jgi:phthalate 4,5-dioxygenase reductase subunit
MQTEPITKSMHQLKLERMTDVAQGVRAFVFTHPEGQELPAYAPGAHIGIRVPSGDLRKYSLCGDPQDKLHYTIAIKREDQGRGGSISMFESAHVGDLLEVAPPDNAFELLPSPAGYLFIAGGIGITPILSMIRSLGDPQEPDLPWSLVYLNREPQTCAFRDELASEPYRQRVKIHHSLGDPAKAFDLWPLLEKPNKKHIYCCGPQKLMEAVRDMSGHWSPSQIHFESFNAGGSVRPDDQPFTVKLASSGAEYEVPVGRSILETLREQGVRIPYSCESGTCGSCKTGLLEGQADHRDMALMPGEENHQIMVCVSRACTPTLTLDL